MDTMSLTELRTFLAPKGVSSVTSGFAHTQVTQLVQRLLISLRVARFLISRSAVVIVLIANTSTTAALHCCSPLGACVVFGAKRVVDLSLLGANIAIRFF